MNYKQDTYHADSCHTSRQWLRLYDSRSTTSEHVIAIEFVCLMHDAHFWFPPLESTMEGEPLEPRSEQAWGRDI